LPKSVKRRNGTVEIAGTSKCRLMTEIAESTNASEDVAARVLTALRNVNGPEVPITPDTLAPIDHFHGKGVIATEELAEMLQPEASDHILDIGCGIGGPARWIAAKYGCRITGVDLTPGFCEAARELNRPYRPCCADKHPARLSPGNSRVGRQL